MGLDVYVGPLSRYFMREWQLEVERLLSDGEVAIPGSYGGRRELRAIEVKTRKKSFTPESWPEAISNVVRWRRVLLGQLGITAMPEWRESEGAPYFTRKVTWECYSALLLWAAHDENHGLPLPKIVPEGDLDDRALEISQSNIAESKYPQLLGNTEVWLPIEDGRTFRGPDPGGMKLDFGFLIPLFSELTELNQSTWAATEEQIDSWYRAGPPEHKSSTEECAKFAFAVLRVLCRTAHTNSLPMVLDY